MLWQLFYLAAVLVLFLVSFSAFSWGVEASSSRNKERWIFLHPGSGGS